jgi:uncharacterized membrane protein YhdT
MGRQPGLSYLPALPACLACLVWAWVVWCALSRPRPGFGAGVVGFPQWWEVARLRVCVGAPLELGRLCVVGYRGVVKVAERVGG